jgi:hypothetical protein
MAEPQTRPDHSNFVVHLTREYDGKSPMENLLSILNSKRIEARSANCLFIHTMKELEFSALLKSKFKTVSFTESPIHCIYRLADPLIERKIKLAPYGVVFAKSFLEERQAGSVHYVNALHDTGERDHWLKEFRRTFGSKNQYAQLDKSDRDSMIKRYAKIDVRTESHDFAWEREWRHVGDVEFDYSDVEAIICPHRLRLRNLALRVMSKSQFRKFEMLQIIDADWSMDELIEYHASKLRQLGAKLSEALKPRLKSVR